MSVVGDVGLILTPVVVGLGFYFARRQLASAKNARMSEIVMAITARWNGPELEEGRHRINKLGSGLAVAIQEADASNSDDFYPLVRVANFFDALGLLVMEGFLSRQMAYDLFGAAEEHYYGLYKPVLEDVRLRESLECFQKLHDTFKAEAASRSKTEPRRSP